MPEPQSAIDAIVAFRCTECGAEKGACDCWEWCDCCERFHRTERADTPASARQSGSSAP